MNGDEFIKMLINKYQLKIGQKIKMIWKDKEYIGIIDKLNFKEWAEITKGRFIAIDIKTDTDRIIGMPFTSRAKYEILDK
jgi:hypothetical protein